MNAQASNMLGRGGKKQLSWAPSTGASGLYQRAKRQRILSLTRANATGSPGESQHAALQRREALNLGLFTASAAYLRTCLDTGNVAIAADLAIFWGAANPPATYGATARTTQKFARYSFDYPEDWTEAAINKVEKGTNGTDCRLKGALRAKEQVYVVVLQRLGEDLKGYKTTDIEKSLSGIAVADAKLQDALAQTDNKVFVQREVNGQTFFDLDVEGQTPFLITLTNDGAGRFYAMFISATAKGFAEKKALFKKMRDSFRTYVIV